jgi:hypothetical protein
MLNLWCEGREKRKKEKWVCERRREKKMKPQSVII